MITEYIDRHPANDELKLKDSNGNIWHRTGDIGYFCESGNLWLVGRIKDQITSKSGPIPCYDLEEDLSWKLNIDKSAFVDSLNTLFIQGHYNEAEVLSFLKDHGIEHFKIHSVDNIPVDKRHFSRVDRSELIKLFS